MNCQKAESLVTKYIDHTLSVEELEAFLEHIENCPSCYEELETYFIVHVAVMQLDENMGETTLNLKNLLEKDIESSKRYIFKKKLHRALAGVGFCALIAGLGGFLLYVIMQTL